MKTFKEKIRTYSFWTGLSAAVVMLLNAIAKCFGFSIDDSLVEDIIMSICGVLVAVGFVCAPKSQKTDTLNTEESIDEEQTKTSDEQPAEAPDEKEDDK